MIARISVALLLAMGAPVWPQGVNISAGRRMAPAAEAPPEKPEDYGSVEGSVVSAATGEPLRKATLTLMRIDTGMAMRAPLMATSGADGKYLIRNVPPGSYRMNAQRAGYVTAAFGSPARQAAGTVLTLAAKQTVKEVNFKLLPQGVITGRVLDEDGEGVMNTSVQVLRYAYIQGRRRLVAQNGAQTNDLGEFRIHSLAPGRYILSATYRMAMYPGGEATVNPAGTPDEGYAPTYYPNAKDASGAATLEIVPGSVLRGIDIRLEKTRTSRVRGKVMSPGLEGRLRGSVSLVARDGGMMGGGRSFASLGPDGHFEIRGVVPGSYTLIANSYEQETPLFARQQVEVTSSNVDNIQLLLTPGFELTGKVSVEGESGCSVQGISFALTSQDSGIGGNGGMARPDGTLAIRNLSAGVYSLGVYGQTGSCYVKAARVGDLNLLAGTIELGEGPSGSLDILLSPKAGQIDVAVSNAKGNPAAGATIALVPEGERARLAYLYRSGNADQTGRMQLTGISPGNYRLYAWEEVESGAWQDPDFLKPFESRGEKVTIREESRESVQLKAIPAGMEDR